MQNEPSSVKVWRSVEMVQTIQCPLCIAAFKSSEALQAHAVYSHRAGFFTCVWCAKLIETESKIEEHAKSCTELAKREEDEFEAFCIVGNYCAVCESSFLSDIRAIKHYKEIHLHCTYICGICIKYFHKKETFDLHCADKHSGESQPSISVAMQMKQPTISKRSIGDKFKCHPPNNSIPTFILTDTDSDNDDNTDMCFTSIPSNVEKSGETISMPPVQPNSNSNTCDHCGFVFKANQYLKYHLKKRCPVLYPRKPNDRAIFHCPFCEKSRVQETNLLTHIRTTHTQDECRRYREEIRTKNPRPSALSPTGFG